MNAEEFYKNSDYDIDDYIGSFVFAEAYLQHRVNKISDEDIENEFPIKGDFNNAIADTKQTSKRLGAKWFKNKILKL